MGIGFTYIVDVALVSVGDERKKLMMIRDSEHRISVFKLVHQSCE